MGVRTVKITLPSELVQQPVVYNMARQFEIVTNIARASVSREQGWLVLELSGADDDIARAIDWARQQGVRVEEADEETS
jgi:ABC-type methionine transport system ATPase subunit